MIKESKPKILAPRTSGQARQPPEFYQLDLDYVNYTDTGEPSSYNEAIATLDADTWPQAMRSKMDCIRENDTWELIKLPTGRKLLPCKWVYRYKYVFGSEEP